MRAKPFVPRVRVKRVSTTCQLRKMVSLLPVLLFLPKLKSYCLLYGLALPGLLITFHLTLISDAPCYVFVLSAIFTFSWRGVSFCLHRHRLNRTTRPASGFTYTIKKAPDRGALFVPLLGSPYDYIIRQAAKAREISYNLRWIFWPIGTKSV